MKFGPLDLAQAEGAVLAHGTEAMGVQGTYRLLKGTVLTAAHLQDLAAAGVGQVIAARLDPGDVPEDRAATLLAQAVAGPGLEVGGAGTGRVNLRAEGPGIVQIDAAAIEAANRVDPGITIATVPPWQRLAEGGMAATIKIIPFAVSGTALDAACAAARRALSLRKPVIRTATLIETRIGPDTPPDKGRRAIAGRLDQFGVALSPRTIVPHDRDAIAAGLATAPGELRLILTASATCDLRDVAPEALNRAEGRVLHYGMPVDPGNLLFIGEIPGAPGPVPVIGLPGCARSPALNGADWVLERVICGLSAAEIDLAGMGVGGLLKEIPSRPQPRARNPDRPA